MNAFLRRWPTLCRAPRGPLPQTFELTFDLSVFDLSSSRGWRPRLHPDPGAKICPGTCRSRGSRSGSPCLDMMPMTGCAMLKPGSYPGLRRLGLFCGEALPAEDRRA
ncbi:MAG: hypothetical protein R3E53_07570 [Myxococcota bacterium]